ncbi:MAG TPA: hypothetical protein VGN64_03765, partial [Dyadobacter sp.]|nr:hypothetical protein [Dyadobacter sp.]
MKKIYQNRTLKVQQSIRYMLLLVLGIYLTSGRVWSQACPVLDGGTRTFRFSEANDYTFFPATIPAGKSGQSRATAGRLIMSTTKTVVYPVRTVTINPEFTDGTLGKAVLRFDILDMTPGAEI